MPNNKETTPKQGQGIALPKSLKPRARRRGFDAGQVNRPRGFHTNQRQKLGGRPKLFPGRTGGR